MTTEEKACIECNELWPNDAEFFHRGRGTAELLRVCHACYQERYRTPTRRSKKLLGHACQVFTCSSPAGRFSQPGQRQPKTRKKASLNMQIQAPTTDSEIYTAQQLAELLGCDKETAEARIRQGDLPGVKFGKGWIVPRQAFIERVNEMAKEEAATRRAHLQSDQAASVQRGRAINAPSPLLPFTAPKKRPIKRRTPPTLPALPTATHTENLG